MPHPIVDSTPEHIFGTLTPEASYAKHGVTHTERFAANSRGVTQCTRSWQPRNHKLRSTVMVCHGYADDSGWLVQLTCIAIAKRGYIVYAIDHQGHGKSQGLKAHIPKIDSVVDDCIEFFNEKRRQHTDLPAFLYGESLGGAIAVLVHLRQPKAWAGLILNAAMCGISEKFKPPWPAEPLLNLLGRWIATWAIVPTSDICTVSFKEPWKRELARNNPTRYLGKLRAATALELRVAREIQARSSEVTAPLLILHGEKDTVTEAKGSEWLHSKASSLDKTLHIYPELWHQIVGESQADCDKVFEDIYSWLDARTP